MKKPTDSIPWAIASQVSNVDRPTVDDRCESAFLPGGLVRRWSRRRSWDNYGFRLINDVPIRHRWITDSAVVHPTTATATSAATGVITAVVAGVPAVGRITVEIAPVAFAATSSAPRSGHEQGEHATERSAMPTPVIAAGTAGVGTRIAARTATVAIRPTTWSPDGRAAVTTAVVTGHRAPRGTTWRPNRSLHGPTCRSTAIIARRARIRRRTTAAGRTGTIAKDRLQKSATGVGRQQATQQTEEYEPFHDIVPLLLTSYPDSQQTLSSEQSEESRNSLESLATPNLAHSAVAT
jgi:hypothetical protein